MKPLQTTLLLTASFTAFAGSASAQYTFSIDRDGPTHGAPDCGSAIPIKDGDILSPCTVDAMPALGALPSPRLVIPASGSTGLGLTLACPVGAPSPGASCFTEVDAISYGVDFPLDRIDYSAGRLGFSVDVFAIGRPGLPMAPDVESEGATPGSVLGDAAADVFLDVGLRFASGAPLSPTAAGNTGFIDGNGLVSFAGYQYPGAGLVEPNGPFGGPNPGDNVDAIDLDGPSPVTFPASGVYFSLEGSFIDPFTGIPGTGSAAAQGFAPGDVIYTPTPGGTPVVYASAASLGLDFFGPGTDDLDALSIWESGLPGYQAPAALFDWITLPGFDMLLFSVRRGSAVIGQPNSLTGLPIEEGDVLTAPIPASAGGLSPFPAIFVTAEYLGLGTIRSGFPSPFGNGGDDLDALDVLQDYPELITNNTCFCPVGPCGNNDPNAGCANSTGIGALMAASGTSSVAADDLVLDTSQLPTFQNGLYYMGTLQVNNFIYDGIQCALGNTFRFLHTIQSSGPTGTMTGTDFVLNSGSFITPGQTFIFQCWYRDVPGTPCGTGANFSNGVSVLFTP